MEMDHLFWAYAVIWLSLAGYLWFMAGRQASVRRELRDLTLALEEKRKTVTEKEQA